jgi:tetratricopeptide (TPR) repeat protein
MSLKEIEKLREKVDKDPNSKLFVPLAEEYRKEGMLDEAVDVLLKGIEAQPGYMSARVSLGKIYLEKGMPKEAREEFESVVRSIPDNLYAQKKLAEIYRNTGQRELAIQSYRTVLRLNAMDEEAMEVLRTLESGEEEFFAAETPAALPESAEETAPVETSPEVEGAEIPVAVEAQQEPQMQQEGGAEHAEDDLRAFKDSLFGAEQAEKEKAGKSGMAEDEIFEVLGEQTEEPGEVSFGEIAAVLKDEGEKAAPPEEDVIELADEELSFAEFAVSAQKDNAGAEEPFFAEAAPQPKGPTIEEAERRISEGNYAGAINIYRNLLILHPDDRRTLQRLEELKVLLKLLGKDKETLIAKLDAFLEGVEKRRDEFLRRS